MNTARRLWILSGAFGGLLFAINLTIGAGLTYATGNPGFSGLVTGFTTSFVFYILVRTTERFGAVTIAFTLYCLFAIPTVLMGPPGPYKVLVGFLCGLAFDSILYFFRYRFSAYLGGFVIFVAVMLPAIYLAYLYLDFPGIDRFRSLMFILAGIFVAEGWIAAWVAKALFNRRISELSVVKKVSLVPLRDEIDEDT